MQFTFLEAQLNLVSNLHIEEQHLILPERGHVFHILCYGLSQDFVVSHVQYYYR